MARILVIDDEPLHREHAAKILRDAGHEVLIAEDGTQGLEVVATAAPEFLNKPFKKEELLDMFRRLLGAA